jgi:hypothetical protein
VLAGASAAALALCVSTPATAVDVGNGPATVTLEACAQGSSQTNTYFPGCSYVHLVGKDAPSYTYLTSQGAVSWLGGSASNRVLTFPAAGQTWPTLTGLHNDNSITWRPEEIGGSIDADGTVSLAILYEMTVHVPNGPFPGKCKLNGFVGLTSQGTEPLGGQAIGKNYDPATGRFAVVSTDGFPPLPSLNPTCLRLATVDYDLLKGIAWYLTGTLDVPPAPPPVVPRQQTAKVKLPKKIAAKGKTVLLKKAVTTNAGQQATPTVTWSKGSTKRFASVKVTSSGKVIIKTTGKAKRLRVALGLSAPATAEYTAYSSTTRWLVKKRR